jgi:hypothetical protein
MTTSKEIIYFVLVFVLFIVTAKCSINCSTNKIMKLNLSLLLGGIMMTGFLALIYYLANIGECKDGFNFEVTPVKKCCGGPYMYSSNPKVKKFCDNVTPDEKAQVCCGSGFNGSPVHFERTSMSDDMYENKMCNNLNSKDPYVL